MKASTETGYVSNQPTNQSPTPLQLENHPAVSPHHVGWFTDWKWQGWDWNRPNWKKISQQTVTGILSVVLNLTVLSSVSFAYTLLSPGDRGPEVTELQMRLQQRGYSPGPIDGVYGSATEAAVRRFQQDNDLYQDGVYGEDTDYALRDGVLPDKGAGGSSGSELSCQNIFPSQNYVVVIPGDHLRSVPGRACLRQDGRGKFTAAGEFGTYTRAKLKSDRLRKRGLDARVVYFP
ncbi:MAG: peptidoglycan-binding protein [Scytolyngbya sp. HA4215-MV1]|nr:peptidoglycan-binding protein [Scytolyngbya sp. HA4215-MV1]